MLRSIPTIALTCDVVSYNTSISACEKDSQWEEGMQSLQEMSQKVLTSDIVSYNTAMTGCDKGSRWETLS